MRVDELLALEPKLEVYELKTDGKYLICLGEPMAGERRRNLSRGLQAAMEAHGLKLVGVVDFVPRVFELEPAIKGAEVPEA